MQLNDISSCCLLLPVWSYTFYGKPETLIISCVPLHVCVWISETSSKAKCRITKRLQFPTVCFPWCDLWPLGWLKYLTCILYLVAQHEPVALHLSQHLYTAISLSITLMLNICAPWPVLSLFLTQTYPSLDGSFSCGTFFYQTFFM